MAPVLQLETDYISIISLISSIWSAALVTAPLFSMYITCPENLSTSGKAAFTEETVPMVVTPTNTVSAAAKFT